MIYGERIKQAREICGFTQTQLGNLVGVNQSAIAHIESNRNTPTNELVELIAQATDFLPPFFEREPLEYFPVGSLNFRARTALTAREKARTYQYASLIFEQSNGMLAKLNIPPVNIPMLPERPDVAARVTRDALGIPPDSPVVNVINSIEKSGGLVIALPIDIKDLDAFASWAIADEDRPLVALTSGKPGDRLRFSVAHELGHLVMHSSLRRRLTSLEREADQFAAEFLMPGDVMKDWLISPVTLSSIAGLKKHWGVSMQALIRRAYDLGIVTERQYRYLFEQLSARGWRRREPTGLDIVAEKPRTFRRMVEKLYGDPNDVKRYAHDMSLGVNRANDIINEFAMPPGVPPQESEYIVSQNQFGKN